MSRLCRSHGVALHAAQAVGGQLCRVDALGAVSLYAHSQKGVGVLYVSGESLYYIRPAWRRAAGLILAGTMPTHQLVGMGEALRMVAFCGAADHNMAR